MIYENWPDKTVVIWTQWNARTLLAREAAAQTERRTALVAMELAIYNIVVSKTWNTLSSGVANPKKKREAGGGFAIKKDIVK